jgi:hypothetical protein
MFLNNRMILGVKAIIDGYRIVNYGFLINIYSTENLISNDFCAKEIVRTIFKLL